MAYPEDLQEIPAQTKPEGVNLSEQLLVWIGKLSSCADGSLKSSPDARSCLWYVRHQVVVRARSVPFDQLEM
jgi:hypothetical protein